MLATVLKPIVLVTPTPLAKAGRAGPPPLFLNLLTLSLTFRQGISSSGEFPVVLQPGQALVSDSISADLKARIKEDWRHG